VAEGFVSPARTLESPSPATRIVPGVADSAFALAQAELEGSVPIALSARPADAMESRRPDSRRK